MPIRTWNHFWIERNNVQHEFSSTHVRLPGKIASKVIKWGKDNIAPEDIYNADGKYGREDEIHVTVLYGIHDSSEKAAEEILRSERPIVLELGKVAIFNNNPQFDVVKIDVISPDLHRVRKELADALEYTDKYPRYHPHVTIAYVKKGTGEKYEGGKYFDGDRISCDAVIFSSKIGKKTPIELYGLAKLKVS